MLGVHSPVCSVAHAPLRMLLSSVSARLSPRCRFLQRKSQRASQRDDSHHCIAGIEISELQAHRLDVPGEVCFHRAEPARPAVGLPARRCTGVAFLARQNGRTWVRRTTLTVQTKKLHAAELAKATRSEPPNGHQRVHRNAPAEGHAMARPMAQYWVNAPQRSVRWRTDPPYSRQ